jgi:ParB-like chromosome segregation protein Spo0J
MKPKINPALSKLVVNIESLTYDLHNARKHNTENVRAIKNSLERFGMQKPIVALEDGTVIAGNGTLKAAKQLGWDEIAVVRFKDRAQAQAFALADNRTGEMGEWDQNNLDSILNTMKAPDIKALGFEVPSIETDTELERETLRPYHRCHLLISMPIEKMSEFLEVKKKVMELCPEAEIEESAN